MFVERANKRRSRAENWTETTRNRSGFFIAAVSQFFTLSPNRQLCELLNSHLRIHKWPIQEVYTLMTRHRSVHHTLRTLRIIARFKVEIISTFQMATQKITETLYYPVTTTYSKSMYKSNKNIVKSVKIG